MEVKFGSYTISDQKERLDIDAIAGYLAKSYWANNRSQETIAKSIENSLCYGVYDAEKQIAFARVITDDATTYYLCDVIINEAYRGQGIGTNLVQTIVESERLRGLNGILGTLDAHGLYEKFGFERVPDRFMRRASNG
ncbi:GNAT family N-acetyltransferase [Paenibacillus sp. FJAT-26967]|uniref:GNAT family N-acetyltransferase n=1 Tax=Paenibacillus sp. FJAT-26967 TaxID=1729690 RepID=UPI000837C183|nr:GNAT family N-acetyltransferase [Paenibacillus sp. FJAT-26967]